MAGLPERINVLAELERCGVKYEWAGTDHVKAVCPFHEDTSPSCSINIEKREFRCHAAGCGRHGDFVTFLAGLLSSTRAVVLTDLSKRYALDDTKTVSPELIEQYHRALKDAGPLLKELEKRGVTPELIRKYRLGEVDGRVAIPIKNEGGLYVNIRKYLPGAPGKDKMRNLRGHGKIRLWPTEQLQYDQVVVCGGEIKAIVAAAHLNAHGVGAITATGGEGNWDIAFNSAFAGKKVFVCLDVDEEGQKSSHERCAQLSKHSSWVANVLLPLDLDKYPHGDVNDFIASERGDLYGLLQTVNPWVARRRLSDLDCTTLPEDVGLTDAVRAEFTGKRVKLAAVVSAMDTSPYVVPSRVKVMCDKSQRECVICPVFASNETEEHSIPCESDAILEMVAAHKSTQRESLMRGIGVPVTCKVAEFVPLSFYNVEDARVSPQLEITNRASDRVMQPALCIGRGLDLNEGYHLTGRMYPHPKTQQSTLLISAYEPTRDALSTYVCEDLDALTLFRPAVWTVDAIGERLDGLYDDLEANVTRIFRRRDLHLMIDLAYHSPLLLTYDDRVVKGWVEVLILGDSGQGKSETAMNMMRHYGLGEKIECKNATVAGLLGGLQKMGERWFVSWGVIPTHDKRLVVMEELKGASYELIGKLTDMRSSGIAEIPKIEKRRTHARTRLIALSNTRSGLNVASYNFGIETIKELIGGLEDVRRFDAALIVSQADVPAKTLNLLANQRPTIEHVHTGELCRSLILWAWTRSADQVIFDGETTSSTMNWANRLCETFTSDLPLVDRGSMRLKIARLAASLAARTFSCDDTRERVVVRQAHVDYVGQMIERLYGSPTFGYADFTAAQKMTTELLDPSLVVKKINDTPFPRDFARHCLHTSEIELVDIQDWCGWDRTSASDLLSFLVRKHALIREGRAYRKTPPFIALLKGVLEGSKLHERPDHIEEF